MFERYTEKARRVIFFARYEASNFRSPYIETEHLLLAVVREAPYLFQRLGLSSKPSIGSLRTRIEADKFSRPSVSTSVDLPLSNECKRVLAYAAEEAERLQHRHIGVEHLLMGLLRDEGTVACRLLVELGITLALAHEKLAAEPTPFAEAPPPLRHFVKTHGVQRDFRELQPTIAELRHFFWEKREWKPADVLLHRATGRIRLYDGQPYDSEVFELKPGGWACDRCQVCRWELHTSPDPEHGFGYSNGRSWVCTECGDKFIIPAKLADNFPDFT